MTDGGSPEFQRTRGRARQTRGSRGRCAHHDARDCNPTTRRAIAKERLGTCGGFGRVPRRVCADDTSKRFSCRTFRHAFLGNAHKNRRKPPSFFPLVASLHQRRLHRGSCDTRARARAEMCYGRLGVRMPSAARRRRARNADHDVAAGPSLDSLPVDVLLHVTQSLGGAELLRSAAVSRGWRDALEPAFESRCVRLGREDRAWRFPEASSIETRSTPQGDGGCESTPRAFAPRYRTWREAFRDNFCAWCREAPNARVNLVGTFQTREAPREQDWAWLASLGVIARSANARSAPNIARRERVTLCGGCLARDAAKVSTRPYGMELYTTYGTPRYGPPREGDVMIVSRRFGEAEFAMIWESGD